MRPQDKNTMQRNLRRYVERGASHLPAHEVDALKSVVSFLQKPIGSEFKQFNYSETEEKGTKKSDCFEVVSATGSGKTYMLGLMAKAMNVPTLILTPRNLLNRKTKKAFCEEMGIPEKDVAVYDSRQPEGERKRLLEGNPPPKFVVTSYQSLPSLMHRHELDFTNPEDVHYRPLVILDEVHEAQGPKTSKLVRELMKHVMVAGFTATDAGAASTLFEGQKPIYSLPLVEAVKRDILCEGIQTGVLDVAIDKSWVAKFKGTPRGRDYKKSDIEAYARIPSVMEGAIRFHLTADHPKLGRLHRLPSVFFVEGVETAKEAADRYNQIAAELGISSRAAYVSGTMKDAALPILEQWGKGEIQAVFNDKLIGMGHDAKNATIAYSLKPSNLPYVVEQQMGRATRKQGEDYVEKYGQNKLALAINVRGKGMNPYLFAQVLQSPDVYSERYMQTRKEHGHEDSMPKLRYHLPEGVEVHFDYADMATVLSEANRERVGAEQRFPPKPDGWLSPSDMQGIFIGGSQKLEQILRDYSDRLVAAKISAGLNDVEARAETDLLVGERTSVQGASVICASPEAIATLERQGELRRKDQRLHKNKEANWLSFVELAGMYVGSSSNIKSKMFDYADKKCAEFEISGMSEAEARSLVYEEYIGLRTTSRGRSSVSASPRAIEEMKAYEILRIHEPDLKPKEANWYSVGEKSRMDIASGKDVLERKLLQYAIDKRNSLVASGILEPEARQIVDYEVGNRLVSGVSVLCAAPHVFEALVGQGELKTVAQKAPPVPTGWQSANQVSYDYKGGGGYFNQEFYALRDKKIAEFTGNGVPLPEAERVVFEEWIGLRTVANTETLCASPAAIEILRQEGKLKPKGQTKKLDWEWLSKVGGRIVGGEPALKIALTEYVALKREELLASGALAEEADTLIETEVCTEINKRVSGERKLTVNPNVVQFLMDSDKITLRKQKESNWLSTTEMRGKYSGKAAKFDAILEAYIVQKRDSMTGAPPKTAAKVVDAEYAGLRGTQDVLCASPKALSELEQAGLIVRRDKMPPPKDDWLSISDVGARYSGDLGKLRAIIQAEVQRRIDDLRSAEPEKNEEQVAEIARTEWAGPRTLANKTSDVCFNPALLVELEGEGKLKPKGQTKKLDWEWVSEVGVRIVGGEPALKMALTEYVALKREELLASGALAEEADALIETEVCTEINTRVSGERKLAINPNVLHLLMDSGKITFRKQKGLNWLSTNEMPGTYSGRPAKFDTILEAYIAQKRESVTGANPLAAAKVVDAEYAGPRGTKDALCASPKALSELEQAGLIVRHDKMPPPKDDWLTISDVGSRYSGALEKLRAVIQAEVQRRIDNLRSAEPDKTEAQIAEIARTKWAGPRTLANKRSDVCINPSLLDELEQQGNLKRSKPLGLDNPGNDTSSSCGETPSDHSLKGGFVDRFGGKRDIAPGGDHLKRIGRSRGEDKT